MTAISDILPPFGTPGFVAQVLGGPALQADINERKSWYLIEAVKAYCQM